MSDPAPMSRRRFLASAAAAVTAAQFCGQLRAAGPGTGAAATTASAIGGEPIRLRWLEGVVPAIRPGTTVGVPWPRGIVTHKDQTFTVNGESGEALPVQSWPLATWPDGS